MILRTNMVLNKTILMIKPYQSTSGMKKKHVHATFDQIRGFQKDTSQIDLDYLN